MHTYSKILRGQLIPLKKAARHNYKTEIGLRRFGSDPAKQTRTETKVKAKHWPRLHTGQIRLIIFLTIFSRPSLTGGVVVLNLFISYLKPLYEIRTQRSLSITWHRQNNIVEDRLVT